MAFYYLWPRLLEELMFSFCSWAQLKDEYFVQVGPNENFRKKYRFKDYRMNLVDPPNVRHSKELEIERYKNDIACIGSRRALLFNLFGNENTFIVPNPEELTPGKYSITYKKIIKTLKGKNLTTTLDAILYNKKRETMIVSRVRMFEWLVLKNDLIKEQYLHPESYMDEKSGKVFSTVVRRLLSEYMYDCEDWVGKFTNLDGLHIIKEIIAAYNLLSTNEEYKDVKRLTIVENFWTPKHYESLGQAAGRVFVKERNVKQEAEEMRTLILPVINLFRRELGVKLEIKCINLRDMVMLQIKNQKQMDWYYRYII